MAKVKSRTKKKLEKPLLRIVKRYGPDTALALATSIVTDYTTEREAAKRKKAKKAKDGRTKNTPAAATTNSKTASKKGKGKSKKR